ncbi:MAG: response regulator transcription factor [Acidobacteria bacterium]|nr:response regulator transcription factor [Acidobacteriota bacterium]
MIVDDEALARQRVARYLRQSGQDLLIEEAESGIEAVEKIREFHPDIVFLDVEMPGLNGFEVLQQFDERPFHVIFQTAYDQFAIRAFEEHACDYLLKPFTAERLSKALMRALDQAADEERLRALEAQLATRDGGKSYLRRLTVRQGLKLRIVETPDIVCFVSRDHYTCVYFNDGGAQREGLCDLSLARLAERLDPAEFQPLHRNNIARVPAIVSMARSREGELVVEMSNGMRLPVSRSHRKKLRVLVKGDNRNSITN